MKARNPSTGNLEEIYVKALDSMPIGSTVEYSGSSADIPAGWEEVNDYSKTAEINTGKKWLDGKDIYRMTYEVNATFSNWSTSGSDLVYDIQTGLTNIDNLFFEEGASSCKFSNGYITNVNNNRSSSDFMKCNFNTSNGYLRIAVPSAYSGVTALISITINYTKTN